MLSDMIMGFVSMMLGPSGMKILDWYVQNNIYVNGVVVAFALLYILFPNQSEKIIGKIQEILPGSWSASGRKNVKILESKQASQSEKDQGARSRK